MLGNTTSAKKSMGLRLLLGKGENDSHLKIDIEHIGHMLLYGPTGTGKSSVFRSMLTQAISDYSPDELRIIILDPISVEFSEFTSIPHLACPISKTKNESQLTSLISYLTTQSKERIKQFDLFTSDDFVEYNASVAGTHFSSLPRLCIFIDSFEQYRASPETMNQLIKFLQMDRATGIHLILNCSQALPPQIANCFSTRTAFRIAELKTMEMMLGADVNEVVFEYGRFALAIPYESNLRTLSTILTDDACVYQEIKEASIQYPPNDPQGIKGVLISKQESMT